MSNIRITKEDFSSQMFTDRFSYLQKMYKKGNILDIGNVGGVFGEGKSDSFHLHFVEYTGEESTVYGFDLFPAPVEHEHLYTHQKQGNIEHGLPYEDNFFDTVYMGEVLEHLPNTGISLQEVKRVLKDDGVFILDVPNAYSLYRIIRYAFKRYEDLGDPTHLVFFTPASLRASLGLAGFEIIDLNTRLSKKMMPAKIFRGLGGHILCVAKKND
ncbi:MAG: class I SAM-dependent methyltransferase [Candidatus Magasanikbacteria bacterium]|nr:class I SAM-dependent methyltransferase [Candidatus Magasanikbacteria bacterium]